MIRFIKLKKRILLSVMLISLVLLSACGTVTGSQTPDPNATPTVDAKPVYPELGIEHHSSFEKGLGTIYNDCSSVTDYVRALLKTNDNEAITGNAHFDDMLLLLSVIELELSVLDEFDMLDTVAGNEDRAEGDLIITENFGFKINRGTSIDFGYTEADGKVLDGSYDKERNILKFELFEEVDETLTVETVIDLVMLENETFVMRASKVAIKDGNIVKSTKSVCILIKDGIFSLGYYDGPEGISGYLPFDMLLDYNMDAVMFGVDRTLYVEMSMS